MYRVQQTRNLRGVKRSVLLSIKMITKRALFLIRKHALQFAV